MPLEAECSVDVCRPRASTAGRVGERAAPAAGGKEVLTVRARLRIGAGVGVAYVTTQLKSPGFELILFVLPIEVGSGVLRGRQAASATTAATAVKSAVVDVVCRAIERDTRALGEACRENASRIPVLGSVSKVDVVHPRGFQLLLGRDVEHGGLLAVVDTRLLGIVALLVVCLYLADPVDRQVLHRDFRVALEEVLTVDEKLGDRLSVPGDGTVVRHLHARQLLHQGFECRAHRGAVGGGIVDRRVLLLLHAGRSGRDDGLVQHGGRRGYFEVAETDGIVILGKRDVARNARIADIRNPDDILACRPRFEFERSVGRGTLSGDTCFLVRFEQLDGGILNRFLCRCIDHFPADHVGLCRKGWCHDGEQE